MTHEKAQQDVRARQRNVVRRALQTRQTISNDEINEVLREARLPEASHEEINIILIGEHAMGIPAEVRDLQSRVVAEFLREGDYANLADAMDKLGLDVDGIWALIQRRCLDALGDETN